MRTLAQELSKNPTVLNQMVDYFGRTPIWEDLTKPNLVGLRDCIKIKVSANSAYSYFAVIKSVLNVYKYEGLIPCPDFEKVLTCKRTAVFNTYLDIDELKALERVPCKIYGGRNIDLTVKYLFLLQAWTGARISDAMLLTADNIVDNELHYTSIKTKTFTRVPLKPIVADILTHGISYEDVSLSTMERTIRRLCRKAGIDSPVRLERGGNTIIGEKWENVTTHTARRSFATNLFEAAVSIDKISKLMGHTSSEMTERYICTTLKMDNNIEQFFA